jgi:HEAT repeat protein
MSRRSRLAATLVLLVSAAGTVACVPDHAPPPPDREALEERRERLDEAAARLREISGASVQGCLEHSEHPDPRVRRAVALRLADIGEPARSAIGELLDLLGDDEPRVRTAAARALGVLGDERAVDPLIAALVDRDQEVRLWSWKALRKHGPAARARLVAHLSSKSPLAGLSYSDDRGRTVPLRVELRGRLPKLGQPIVPHLLAAMENGNEDLQVNTMRVLSQIGSDAVEAVPILARLLETGNQELRFQSTRALGAIGDIDPAVLPALTRASKDPTDQVRRAAERALKDIAEAARTGKGKLPRHREARPKPPGLGPGPDRPAGTDGSEADLDEADLPG